VAVAPAGGAAAAGAALAQLWELMAERLEGAGGVLLPSAQAAALQTASVPAPRALPATAPPLPVAPAPAAALPAPRPSYSSVVAGRSLPNAASALVTPARATTLPGVATPVPLPLHRGAADGQQHQQWQQQHQGEATANGAEPSNNSLAGLLARTRSDQGRLRVPGGPASSRLSDAEASVAAAKQLLSSVSQLLHKQGSSFGPKNS
jgi:hypothetical protein